MGLLDRIRSGQAGDAMVATGTATAEVETATSRPRQQWGRPGRCPQCNGRGYLDHIDLIDRIMYQHCTECRHEWTISEAELVTQH